MEDENQRKDEEVISPSSPEVPQDAATPPDTAPGVTDGTVAVAATPPKQVGRVNRFFGISKSGSTYKTEIVAGITSFMAMVYILMVNAGMFSGVIGGDNPYGAAYIATAIGAIVGTLLMSLLARMPLAQASGMGINAFIVYTLLKEGTGLTYANCMMFTLVEGAIFIVLTVTGLRKKIFDAIPKSVRLAIPVGIGLFIAFIGLQNAGVIVGDGSTLVKFTSFNVLDKNNLFAYVDSSNVVRGILPALVGILGVLGIAVMSKKNVKGAILWGILGSAALYYALAGIGVACGSEGCKEIFTSMSFDFNPFKAFAAWGKDSAGKVFTEGFNFSKYLGIEGNNGGTLTVLLLTTALSMCMIDMFDTLGTLYGACSKGNLLNADGVPIRMDKMLTSDAIATCVGAVAGTSTVTTFVESSSGVAAGGRTGFAALVTAICFFVAMFLSPLAQLIPSAATATALIWVGVLMMTGVTKIDWTDLADAAVAFITIVIMVLGYSISKGIGAGIISYVIIKLCTGKVKEISIPTWVISALFLAMFILTT